MGETSTQKITGEKSTVTATKERQRGRQGEGEAGERETEEGERAVGRLRKDFMKEMAMGS